MARTPLMDSVQETVALIAAERETAGMTRRRLLQRAGLAGLGLTALGRLAPIARGASPASIVVVGAGLAGLTCAYRLRQAGYAAQIHEAATRVGGRCWTGRGTSRTASSTSVAAS
jgi:monoamine oxidase